MKNQKIFFIFLKIILLGVLAVFFYFQFIKIDWNKEHVSLEHPLSLCFVILLMPLNWYLEWLKWLVTLKIADAESSDKINKHSFLAGIVTGMLTPNMLGNFIGRIYYFQRRHRISLIVLTLVSNYAQFIASILFGIIALLFLQKTPFEMDFSELYFLLTLAVFFLLVIYFNFEWIFKLIKRKTRIHFLIRNLRSRRIFRWKIMLLSLIRHGIFTLQFLFMLHAFGEEISLINVFWIWQVYLWVTIAPSLFLGKLAIRESISIWVLAFAGMGELTVLISSFLIWIINLLIPTILGLIICKRKR